MHHFQLQRATGWLLFGCAILAGIAIGNWGQAKDVDALDDNTPKTQTSGSKKADANQGRYTIEIDGLDGKPIESRRSVRGIPGQLSVAEFPRPFGIEGHSLFQAGQRLDSSLTTGGPKIFCAAAADAEGEFKRYTSTCTANLPTGTYSIDPFGLTFEVGKDFRSTHPAIVVQGLTIHIRTAPVTFKSVDAQTGLQTPLVHLQVGCDKADLLKDLLEAKGQAAFNPLTLFLPIATRYQSSFGEFSIDEQGGIHPSSAAAASYKDGAFVAKVERPTVARKVEAIGQGRWISSQNLRRVYKRGETAPFVIYTSGTHLAEKLHVVAKADSHEIDLGELTFPAVVEVDTSLFLLDTAVLPPGRYELSVKTGDAHSFGIEVVDLLPTSPLFLFTVNACGESNFATTSAGLDQLRDTGVRCWTSYGFGGGLDPKGPGVVPYPAPPSDAPAELKRSVSDARALLDDCLRHGLVTIDFEARRDNFYNEGLAYHHSHQISVDRMIRRVQIFGQELGDYPAFAGMSYTWFPALGGYTEGGVRTDPYFEERMRVLEEKVKQQTGIVPLTKDEWRQWTKLERANQPIPQELANKRRKFFRAQQHIGFFDSFDIYNHKLREVRKEFIATTSGNAGHDEGIALADFAGAHDALTWESYTDYGDWPMSAGFCSDWAHGMAPGKAQWMQVEPSQSEPSIVAKQFAKFVRGTEGIGVGVHDPGGARANARRAKSNRFLERYGSLATTYEPDMTVVVCVNELQSRYEYQAHALHSHMTRLGYGPGIISERTIEQGMPAGVKALMLPNPRVPFSEQFQASIKRFMAAGGKVIVVGTDCVAIDGSIRVETPLKHLWDIGGFAAHLEFWDEFKKVRPSLEKVMADIGLAPANGAAPDKAIILPMRAAGMRYVAVIASPLTSKDIAFAPVSNVVVNVGSPNRVVNLVTGQTIPVNKGLARVDLVNEPVAMLVLLDAEPKTISLKAPARITAGDEIELDCDIKPTSTPNCALPVEYVITDASGRKRAVFYRLSGAGRTVRFATSSTEPSGSYSIIATELLTGCTVKASVPINSAAAVRAVAETPAVFVPHPDRVPLFLSRKGEVRIIVEETQSQDLPDAERIAKALAGSGRAARIEKIEPGSYDSYPLRWYPRKHENDLLASIDAGEAIGYRIGLKAYINTSTREHVPERGGWIDIAPDYIVRNDCIVFSGGKLCDSLRAVSDWIQTPNWPGKGNGVIEIALSPFWADRQAVALVATDDTGRRKTVDRLIELIAAGGKDAGFVPFSAARTARADSETIGSEHLAIETPLKAFIPPALALRLTASSDGYSAVETVNAAHLVSPDGHVLRSLPSSGLPTAVSTGGTYFGASVDISQRDPSWNFPTGWKINFRIANRNGALSSLSVPGDVDWIGDRFPGWDGGYAASPDGKYCFAGLAGGGFILFDIPGKSYRRFVYEPHSIGFYDAARAPQFITSVRFSPDSQYVAFTLATHPTGYGGMGRPPFVPYASEIRCVRVSDGTIVWHRNADNLRDGSFASTGDSIAISDSANRIAIINWDQDALLFDANGKELYRKPVFDWRERYGKRGEADNKPSLRVETTHDGTATMFASADVVVLVDKSGTELVRHTIPAMNDARLALDGLHFYASDSDGGISCFDQKGVKAWTVQTQGDNPKIAATAAGVLVAEGAGNLLLLGDKGSLIRKTELTQPTTEAPAELKWEALPVAGLAFYREPETISVLAKYGAKLVARWDPSGTSRSIYGKTFHKVESNLTLKVAGKAQHVAHLVYRHNAANDSGPSIALNSGGKSRTFILDLPTPEYRVVDLPCEEMQDLTVTLTPCAGLEVAELSIYEVSFPGTNVCFVQPAGNTIEHLGGIEIGPDRSKKPKADDLDVLDDKDASQVGKASAGKMKNAAIFANNTDPDQIEGHYLRATGNPLNNLDGRKFLDGKPSFWTNAKDGKWGTRLIVDLNHHARPKLCATYERTLRQSEVMRVIVVLRGAKSDMVIGPDNNGPDKLAIERRGIAGLFDNDQFFNVFDVSGTEMDALGVFVFSGRGKDHGLSEIELFE